MDLDSPELNCIASIESTGSRSSIAWLNCALTTSGWSDVFWGFDCRAVL